MTCPECQHEMRIGEFPFCGGDASKHVAQANSVIGDECDEWIRHGICNEDGSARHYTSKAEMARVAKERNVAPRIEHIGAPGSDKSKFTSRWI